MNRRKTVVNNVDKIGYKFLKLKNIVNGNLKLNLAFVANSFNSYPALDPMKFEEVVEKMHEEKSFHNWMNSLGAKPYLNHLYEDLKGKLMLLQFIDKIQQGLMDRKSIDQPWKHMVGHMIKLENLNCSVKLGKQLKFYHIGIQGTDILDGNKTFILSLF
jgi:hypothetical protein